MKNINMPSSKSDCLECRKNPICKINGVVISHYPKAYECIRLCKDCFVVLIQELKSVVEDKSDTNIPWK